jgi:hypothetical protein
VWADVLESLRRSNLPTYVEIDPATNLITELLQPFAVRVGALSPAPAGDVVEVELIISHARHHLRRSNPDFQQLFNALQAARQRGTTVLVTETRDAHEIIDVRPLPNDLVAALAAPAAPLHPPIPFGGAMSSVTLARARQLFDMVKTGTCCPGSPSAPCIPFQYPDDGCWGRAHEMCRLIIAAGVQPGKVWIYGNLKAPTANKPPNDPFCPACRVCWGWHVAPTVLVGTQVYVIDPALFTEPVPRATWGGAQGDPSASLEDSDASVFHRGRGGTGLEYDPTYSRTNGVLDRYRNDLRLRSVGPSGPPPYAQCLPKPPGVQWFGTIGANASGRWFSHSWPSAWHMVWTVMPLTICPGGPQLSWRVQVERANATQCTYWITVRNLTSSPVQFEGRYDILRR